ncbi:MAG: excinuclease ABC subunit C [Flavobacteriaceae bacterium]|nr:excinuclease ABC subunit C [Flavobacteriaceae bacterium]
MSDNSKLVLKTIPQSPGVYQFLNKDQKIIYVGKAKNLKKRVSSYFQKNLKSRKTINLVKNINSIEHVVVQSESDALLLENSLIKKNQPKYNILLRDDKTYPWICIKNERFPRVFLTRKLIKDGSEYFGPYTNIKVINILLNIVRTIYPLRTSNYNFSSNKIKKSDKKLYLKIFKKNEHSIIIGFHENSLKKVSEDLLSEKLYDKNISLVREILNGKFKKVKDLLKKDMYKFSKKMDFEKAHNIKEKLELLENYQSRSTVVSQKLNNIDVFTIISDSENAYINYLQIAYGRVIRFHNQEIKKNLNEDEIDILSLVIINLRQKFNSESKTIISQFNLTKQLNIKFIVPKAGDNKKLLELSLKNCKMYKLKRFKQIQILDPERHKNRIMNQMKVDLKLENEPNHIECFDVSNIQGTNSVAACVVFIDGKPMKKMYRKFIIKTVEGPNDFKSMEEIIYRRYSRLLNENKSLPKLIVIDGGKGQLSSAVKSLKKLDLYKSIPIIGIAKRLEELYFPNDSIPLYLNKKSESLKVIQNLRNEAHRFSLTFHKSKRSKVSLKSELDIINGIGEKTKLKLLKKFKSISNIKKHSFDEVSSEIGKSKTKKLFEFLDDNK